MDVTSFLDFDAFTKKEREEISDKEIDRKRYVPVRLPFQIGRSILFAKHKNVDMILILFQFFVDIPVVFMDK